MDWSFIVRAAQGAAALAWASAAVFFAPGVLRLLRGKADAREVFSSLFCLVALTQIGFTVRWFLFSHSVAGMGRAELQIWTGLYFMSAIEAVAYLFAALAYRRALGRL